MTNSPNGSIFSPLDTSKPQIRLIHIEPGPPDNDEITCTLHLADLEDDSCRYEALSYEWGDASNTSFYIILNGQKFSVRENLWWALLNLRMKETVRIIWIDALCINQENEGERNHQVSQMGKLYQSADRVVAWVGREEQETSAEASPKGAAELMALMDLLKEEVHKSSEGYYYLSPTKSEELESLSPEHLLAETSAKSLEVARWQPLSDFCRRAYWSRLWIIQELVLASEIYVQSGDIQLDWIVLEQAFTSYALILDYLTSHLNGYIDVFFPSIRETVPFKINQQRMARMAPGHLRHTLFDLFLMYQKAECADLRDKVYGLLGMSRDCCQKAVTVDYQSSPLKLCELLLRHRLLYHTSEESNSPPLWAQVSEIFRLLKARTPGSDILVSVLSSEVSLSRQDTTCACLDCLPMGVVTWLDQPTSANLYLDPNIRSRMRADIIDFSLKSQSIVIFRGSWSRISNESLCKLWLETMLRGEGSRHSLTAFVTEGGWSGTAYGTMRVGDLAYQLNNREAFFLRREGQRLLLVGVASFADLLCPYRPIPSNGLCIEVSILRGFCQFFAGGIRFRIP